MSFQLSHLPERSQKPRENGITFALDSGYSVSQAKDFCEVASAHVDIVKLGWGTSYVTAKLEEKLAVYNSYGIPVYFGGTLFEAYMLRDELDKFIALLNHYQIRFVEVSNGTILLSENRKLDIISDLAENFTVLSEVGSKNPDEIMPPYKWVNMIKNELNAGAWKVICEARESGTVGVYRPNGEVRTGLIDEIADQIPHNNLIFEAPQKQQQVWFIKKFGSNVNLGNIKPADVISVETLRLGLRSDTLFDFYTVDGHSFDALFPNSNEQKVSQEKKSKD